MRRFEIKDQFSYLNLHVLKYPAPKSLNYLWTFGSLLIVCFGIQVISGLFLGIFYKPNMNDAFLSVEQLMRQLDYGWFLRFMHANGASWFFFISYLHIAKGLYYHGFLNKKLWFSGLLIYILLMAEAFTGYVLPWGQMSYWAATVITNFFSIIPLIGKQVTEFIWGGFSVGETTLKRFFIFHYFLGLALSAVIIAHLLFLHDKGSSSSKSDNINYKTNFIPLFSDESIFTALILGLFFSLTVFFIPMEGMHPDNFIPADPLNTPAHIVPEWYFLPFYTILRVTPGKVSGILLMGASLIVLFFLPFYKRSSFKKNTTWRIFFCFFVLNFIFLGYLGASPADVLYIKIGRISTFIYFFFLTIFLPWYSSFF
jgi:ubiquinol-cytochrome c reductase cytochrome b subunit